MTLLKLYDLTLADPELRISPFCWAAKFALKHKNLDFETVPLGFTEKSDYPGKDNMTLPILEDGDKLIPDSRAIADYLEKNYDGPALIRSEGERAACNFFSAWVGGHVFPALAPVSMVRVCALAREEDQEYFRSSREERFGVSLEDLAKTPGLDEKLSAAYGTLSAPLADAPFLGGTEPNLSDYFVFAPFQWRRCIAPDALNGAPAPVAAWFERMLDLFDGYARKAKTAA